MALAFNNKKTLNAVGDKVVLSDVTLDSSYPTGGYAVTSANFGLSGVDQIICAAPPLGGVIASYDPVAEKLKLWWSTTGAGIALVEVTNATNVATSVVSCAVFGY